MHGIMGRSALTQHATELFVDAEVSDGPIIIYGEKGTGKLLVAKAIHEICNRKSGPFVKVTCAVLSETLLKREWFCHVRDAYTGAYKRNKVRMQCKCSCHIGAP